MARRFAPVPEYSGYGPVITGKLTSKYIDTALANYNGDTTGSIEMVASGITTGAGESQRVGEQIVLKSVWARGRWIAGTAGTTAEGCAYLVWDRSPNKVKAAITDIFDTISPDSFPRDSNRRRFTILKRWQYSAIGNRTTPACGTELKDVEDYIRLPNLVTEYSGAGTGTITDVQTGALYIVSMGTVATGTTAPTFVVGFRTRFQNP